ncbi:helix-turn-helix domain-containing protein [Bacillus cereus]|nr:helix-turn-helix domain-containing protein [Bacillus cereus]
MFFIKSFKFVRFLYNKILADRIKFYQ